MTLDWNLDLEWTSFGPFLIQNHPASSLLENHGGSFPWVWRMSEEQRMQLTKTTETYGAAQSLGQRWGQGALGAPAEAQMVGTWAVYLTASLIPMSIVVTNSALSVPHGTKMLYTIHH